MTAPTTPAGLPEPRWKSGNEYLPYHQQASHVNPDYRDGWNDCYEAGHAAALEMRTQAEDAQRLALERITHSYRLLLAGKPVRDVAETLAEADAAIAAQAPQAAEPVGHVFTMQALEPGGQVKYHAELYKPLPAGTKLYAAPQAPAAKPLTDRHIDTMVNSILTDDPVQWSRRLARLVERWHGIAPSAQGEQHE